MKFFKDREKMGLVKRFFNLETAKRVSIPVDKYIAYQLNAFLTNVIEMGFKRKLYWGKDLKDFAEMTKPGLLLVPSDVSSAELSKKLAEVRELFKIRENQYKTITNPKNGFCPTKLGPLFCTQCYVDLTATNDFLVKRMRECHEMTEYLISEDLNKYYFQPVEELEILLDRFVPETTSISALYEHARDSLFDPGLSKSKLEDLIYGKAVTLSANRFDCIGAFDKDVIQFINAIIIGIHDLGYFRNLDTI